MLKLIDEAEAKLKDASGQPEVVETVTTEELA